MTVEQEAELKAALLRERESYARLGRGDRVAVVDEQLRMLGVEPPALAAAATGPKGAERRPQVRPEMRGS